MYNGAAGGLPIRPALWLVGLSLLAPHAAPAGVVCVKPGGGEGCRDTIGAGLAAAGAGDTVRVAAGIYTEFVVLDKNVALEGGWNAAFTARDPAANATTIQPPDATFSVVDIEGSFADPSTSTPVLDGFTITGGGGGNHGGGIRSRDSNATIRNNVVTGNLAYLFGGGIWVQRGAPHIDGNRIENNTVSSFGGGGSQGGGVELENTQATLVDNRIAGNRTDETGTSGGGVDVAGGGPVQVRGGSIENSVVGTDCLGQGGALHASGATSLEVDGVRFTGNCGMASAVVAVAGTPLRIENSTFFANDANTRAVLGDAASPIAIANSTILGGGQADGISTASMLTLVNDIVSGHLTGAVESSPQLGPSVVAETNDFVGNTTDTSGFALGPGNLHVDPQLDAAQHLTPGSPLLDAGTRTSGPYHDIDGEPRPMDGGSGRFRFDIGADELSGRAQRVVDVDREAADLSIVGPGNPPENPSSSGSNDWIGYAVLAADVNGDGKDDLVISAQDFANDFDTDNAGGRLFGLLHFGTRRTGTIPLASEPADFQVTCDIELQHLGEELASGDLDGDGARDLVAGASDNHGMATPIPTAYVLFGGAALGSSGAAISAGSPGDFAVRAPATSSHKFAAENGLAAGDLDGDGIDDLAIGDASADDGAKADTGAVFVAFGSPSLGGLHDLAAAPADFTLYGPSAGDGTFATGPDAGGLAIGDLDGDGQPDLVARDATSAYVLFGPLQQGARHLSLVPADAVIGGLTKGGVLVMDATGDGKPDLVLGSDAGLRVIPGPLAAGQTLDAAAAAAYTLVTHARSLAAGDVLGDPRPELLVGDETTQNAWVVAPGSYGPGAVPIGEIAALVVTGKSFRFLGWHVAAGDLDGDGRADLVASTWQVGVPSSDPKAVDAGVVFVSYGDPCGNGALNPPESCDDANASGGDGCSAGCSVETDFACVGAPSACALDVSKLAVGAVSGSGNSHLGGAVLASASLTSSLALDHSGLSLEFWLSADGAFDAAQDRELGSCPLPLLPAGDTKSCGTGRPMIVPQDLPPASYEWFACVATAAGRSCTAGNSILVPEPSTELSAAAALLALRAAERRRRATR